MCVALLFLSFISSGLVAYAQRQLLACSLILLWFVVLFFFLLLSWDWSQKCNENFALSFFMAMCNFVFHVLLHHILKLFSVLAQNEVTIFTIKLMQHG
jgi:hypothetical protein